MDGVELALRFSYIVNKLCYCGPEEAHQSFLQYLDSREKDRNKADDVRTLLRRFEGLDPYLSAIAEKTGKDPFDHDVVEAYWIGNNLLEMFDDNDMADIIRRLMRRGMLASTGERLITALPHSLVPHHDFNVFYVGVGALTGAVPTNLENMEQCRIAWGKVVYSSGSSLTILTNPLEDNGRKLQLGKEKTRTVGYIPAMLNAKKGDYVAVHWGFAAHILTTKQLASLKKYTHRVLDGVNHSRDNAS